MKTKYFIEKGRTSLLVDHGKGSANDKQVLAAMTHYPGTRCWTVIDIRLEQTPSADPWSGSGTGEDFYSQWKPKSDDEAKVVKALLKDYQELPDGTLIWCTYKTIVRGHDQINGSAPASPNGIKRHIYHTKAEAMAKLMACRAFWEDHLGTIAEGKIPNPYRQPGESDIPLVLALKALEDKGWSLRGEELEQ